MPHRLYPALTREAIRPSMAYSFPTSKVSVAWERTAGGRVRWQADSQDMIWMGVSPRPRAYSCRSRLCSQARETTAASYSVRSRPGRVGASVPRKHFSSSCMR